MAEQNNKTKRQLQGVVVSDKMERPSPFKSQLTRLILFIRRELLTLKSTKLTMKSKKPKLVIQSLSKKLVTFQKTSTSV